MPISPYLKELRSHIGHAPLTLPAVCALILNERGDVLLHRATDDGLWRTIGGTIDPHEEPAAAAVREALEETGLTVTPDRIIAVYAGPDMHYPNGDIVWYTTIAVLCRPAPGQQPRVGDDESLEVRYFPRDALPEITPHDRLAVEAAFAGEPAAWFRR